MNNSQQLIKKDKSQVFPKTFLDAIKSRETGASLEEILKGFNMYFVSYTGNTVLTRCQVPIELRKRGLWITYINYQNEVITEWYDATDISNEAWGYDTNWKSINFDQIQKKIDNLEKRVIKLEELLINNE